MPTILTRTLRSAARSAGEPLNILCVPTHERYETNLARTGHSFWALQDPGLKAWDSAFAPIPPNYTVLMPGQPVPHDVPIDLVLSQSRAYQFELGKRYADAYRCPHVALEHVLPPEGTGAGGGRADVNVFISAYSRDAWGFSADESVVIEHGVDTDLFTPRPNCHRREHVLAAANGFKARDSELGYTFWKEATEGLPAVVVGDNPGLSRAVGPADLAFAYQTSLLFANTARRSPVPTVLLEAMASGCCVLTRPNPMIEDFITDGINGFLCDSPGEMRLLLKELLDNPELAIPIGLRGRETILERFRLDRFVADWSLVFEHAANLVL